MSILYDKKQRTYKHWSTLEDRELLQLREEGLKYREIAKKLDRSPLSVEKRYRKIIELYK
ncbi:helix-turn-helix domain-containing protein [Metabacillus arenae]|uniref:Helix-turn-helix domain-containing protein n=1 Tax=Metabacillus arenae TaxID=2771434 RepID=A0A926NHI6_9BACI|nr:helix-turn-helix domain-containing protein [Metabacillus arenae]MBD1381386.1 helix-turn-helix domain-containing protein [Metabacillus arenae]